MFMQGVLRIIWACLSFKKCKGSRFEVRINIIYIRNEIKKLIV